MSDVVELKPTDLAENQEFVSDLCRFAESILTERQVKKKWRFDDATWEKLGDDDRLIELVEAEKIRRVRNGSCKREKAQLLVVKAPDVLGKIMDDDNQSARHRIDSAKVLDNFAANGPQTAPAGDKDRFVITINLGADTEGKPVIERYSKSLAINADDTDPDVDTNVIAAITTNKLKDDGGGQGHL